MNANGRDLWCGILLLALIPLLLLWQSSNTAKGTSPGKSEYNVHHYVGILTEFLYDGEPGALERLCDFALFHGKDDKNPVLVEAWIDNIVLRRGESFYTHLVRGRVLGFRGDRDGARREFAAAEKFVPDADARGRLYNAMIEAGLRSSVTGGVSRRSPGRRSS